MARTTGTATDLITFSRASSGTALTKVAYGAELVTNGTFDTDTSGWTGSHAISSVSGQLSVVGTFAKAYTSFPTTVGATYAVTADFIYVNNPSVLRIGTAQNLLDVYDSGLISASETHTFLFVAQTTTTHFYVGNVASTATSEIRFDNVSVKEVLYNSPTGTLKLISHPTNKPRVEYDANGVAKGLLIEEARTNLVRYSQDFGDSYWLLGSNLSRTLGITDPAGTTTAARITATGSGTSLANAIRRFTDTNIYTKGATSFYVRRVSGTGPVKIQGADLGFNRDITSELTSEWQRFSYSGASHIDSFLYFGVQVQTAGDVVDVAFAQCEAEVDFATSYIPTSGATATRSADIASVSVSEFGYNQAQGSVVVEFSTADISTTNELALSDGTNNNRIMWGLNTAAGRLPYISSGGVNTVALVNNTGIQDGVASKAAIAFAPNDVASSLDGQAVATDTSATIPSAITTLYFLGANGVDNQINGHIKSINYYPLRLSDAKLQELTS